MSVSLSPYDKSAQPLTQSDSPTFTGLTLSGLTASRLLATDANKALASVADLASWVAGTANQIVVAADGDGTITLSAPQDIHTAASPTFTGLDLTGITDGNIPYVGASGFADSPLQVSGSNVGLGAVPETPFNIWDNTTGLRFSHANVAHGITGWTPTTTWGEFRIMDGNAGGIAIRGFIDADSNTPFLLSGLSGVTNTNPYMLFQAIKNSGGGFGAIAATEIAWAVNNNNTRLVMLYGDGGLYLPLIKSGATQAGAGAAAGELWKTASHATLPDNVVMIGV